MTDGVLIALISTVGVAIVGMVGTIVTLVLNRQKLAAEVESLKSATETREDDAATARLIAELAALSTLCHSQTENLTAQRKALEALHEKVMECHERENAQKIEIASLRHRIDELENGRTEFEKIIRRTIPAIIPSSSDDSTAKG